MSEGVAATPGTRIVNGRQVPEPGRYEIDPAHQSFEWIARHLMHKVRGRFPGVTGVATIAEVPEESTLEIEIDANSIDTQDDTRDAHMRSNDFFGVEEHPTISFRSTGVRPGDGDNQWKVDGELTVKGTTRPITVDVEFEGAAVDPWGNQKIGFSGVVPEVDRRDWGLTWNAALETGGFLLANHVRLEIAAELYKK
jgi:polyisoprenoid-binding protein YceI